MEWRSFSLYSHKEFEGIVELTFSCYMFGCVTRNVKLQGTLIEAQISIPIAFGIKINIITIQDLKFIIFLFCGTKIPALVLEVC